MKNVKNPVVEGIETGLKQAIAWAEGRDVPVTIREVDLPDPPAPMRASQIARLRVHKMRVSQAVFARLVNASVQTVHAWEQGRTQPTGPTLRFLRLLEHRPELLKDLAGG